MADFQRLIETIRAKNAKIKDVIVAENDAQWDMPDFDKLSDVACAANTYNKVLKSYFEVMKAVSTNSHMLAETRRLRDSVKGSQMPTTLQVANIKTLQAEIDLMYEDQKTLLFIKDRLDAQLRYLSSVQYMLNNVRCQDKATY